MTWIALSTPERDHWSPAGLDAPDGAASLLDGGADALMPRGSLVLEIDMSSADAARQVLSYATRGDWSMQLAVQVLPGGAVSFVLEQGDVVLQHVFQEPVRASGDKLRLTYAWDAPSRAAFVALERVGRCDADLHYFNRPSPLRVLDMKALLSAHSDRFLHPARNFLALSTGIEAVGPRPTLALSTRIDTPKGPRALGTFRRGDMVTTADGGVLPVLFALRQNLPAAGSFAPLRLSPPSFGLTRDLAVAQTQSIVFEGADVNYHLGQDRALVPSAFLSNAQPIPSGPVMTYAQLVLPTHAALIAEGAAVDSLYVGRLRRHVDKLSASLLADADRDLLPEHLTLGHPVRRRHEAALFPAA